VVYNLRAIATGVRTRYSGLSLTSSANVTLTGNSRRSLLSGTATIERVAYSSSSDIGSILDNVSSPPSTETTPSRILAGLRLDIRVSTSSDVRVVTPYVEKLDLKSTLTVRGTAAQPGLLGHINVTDGQLVFFGNTYTVNTGAINFYDPSAIRPELDFSLETVAQGVDVVLGVTGPMSRMKLSYRSDPPLTFEQIVQLLATNTTPSDPTIAAHQPTPPPQSMSQIGESAVLGQAVASPLASRVQRVFGLTQFKIDPSIAGSNGQPAAKVTLQQKIANNITFTYITDVTQSNSEIVRIQWDLSSKASAVALRDYNGNVSLEMFYKFQVR
jgi:translocation and assembly module TamB